MKLVYCHARSGSTQLVRAARKFQSRKPVFFDEPFKQKNAKRHGYPKNIRQNKNLEDYLEFLDTVRVKHLWSDLPRPLNRRLVKSANVESILFLYRRDLPSYVLSHLTASLTQEWHGATADFIGDMPLKRLLRLAKNHSNAIPVNARLVARHAKAPVYCVAYEDLYGFNGADLQQVSAKTAFSALGITDSAFVKESVDTMLTSTKKYKTDTYYEEIFGNFEQAKLALKPYEDYFVLNPESKPEAIFAEYLTES